MENRIERRLYSWLGNVIYVARGQQPETASATRIEEPKEHGNPTFRPSGFWTIAV